MLIYLSISDRLDRICSFSRCKESLFSSIDAKFFFSRSTIDVSYLLDRSARYSWRSSCLNYSYWILLRSVSDSFDFSAYLSASCVSL